MLYEVITVAGRLERRVRQHCIQLALSAIKISRNVESLSPTIFHKWCRIAISIFCCRIVRNQIVSNWIKATIGSRTITGSTYRNCRITSYNVCYTKLLRIGFIIEEAPTWKHRFPPENTSSQSIGGFHNDFIYCLKPISLTVRITSYNVCYTKLLRRFRVGVISLQASWLRPDFTAIASSPWSNSQSSIIV